MVIVDKRLELPYDHVAMINKLSARTEPFVSSGRIFFDALVTGVPHAYQYQRLHASFCDERVECVFARPALDASICFVMMKKILAVMQVQRRKAAKRLS